jgi:hypothetical protein
VLAVLLCPLVLAHLGGHWNVFAAWLQIPIHAGLVALSEPLDGWGLLGQPQWFLLPIAILWFLSVWGRPAILRVAIDAGASTLGILAGLGVLAVGAAADRPLFAAGCVLMWASRGSAIAGPPGHPGTRVLLGLGLALLAGLTVLEGPGAPSPAFRGRDLWLGGPGRNPALARTMWLSLLALGLLVQFLRPGSRGRRLAGVSAAGVVVTTMWWRGQAHDDLPLREAWSGLALLPWASVLSMFPRPVPSPDPRLLFPMAVPWIAWAGLCAARAFAALLWTAPFPLQPGVEQLSWRQGTFAVTSAPHGEFVAWTDRESTLLTVREGAGVERRFPLRGPLDAAEELGGPWDGRLWVSGTRFSPTAHTGLVPWSNGRLGAFIPIPDCWISSWLPLPPGAAARAQAREGDVLLGCEGGQSARLLRTATGKELRVIPLADDMEDGAFSADGSNLYTVSLWGSGHVVAYEWPDPRVRARRQVGPFNWGVTVDRRGAVWVSRFWEGGLLRLDPDDLAVQQWVRLSFGIRALLYDPARDRLWAAAAYSGRIWEIDAQDPTHRRAHALCGLARDLFADAEGRVIVGTDCGVFRLDPEQLGALP